MAGSPVSAVRHEAADQVPADWSGGSSGVHQVDAMVPGVSLSTCEAKQTHLIQDICKVGCIVNINLHVASSPGLPILEYWKKRLIKLMMVVRVYSVYITVSAVVYLISIHPHVHIIILLFPRVQAVLFFLVRLVCSHPSPSL